MVCGEVGCIPEIEQFMAETLYFLPHIHPHCTGLWQLRRCPPFTLWECPICRAAYPDCEWVRTAAVREIQRGEQMRQLAHEGKRLLRDTGRDR